MVPEHLHVADFLLNAVNLLIAVVDEVWISELISSVPEVADFGVQIVDFRLDVV